MQTLTIKTGKINSARSIYSVFGKTYKTLITKCLAIIRGLI